MLRLRIILVEYPLRMLVEHPLRMPTRNIGTHVSPHTNKISSKDSSKDSSKTSKHKTSTSAMPNYRFFFCEANTGAHIYINIATQIFKNIYIGAHI
jgi:hypothetical protein